MTLAVSKIFADRLQNSELPPKSHPCIHPWTRPAACGHRQGVAPSLLLSWRVPGLGWLVVDGVGRMRAFKVSDGCRVGRP
jgi:hypothetical protein